MLNERDDDKYEATEESEYHFSDEEANYEVEDELTKQPSSPEGEKLSVMDRLTRSKRMLISLGVFAALIAIVYKMVSPTSAPSTDITAASPPQVPAVAQVSPPISTPINQPAPPPAVISPPPVAAPANLAAQPNTVSLPPAVQPPVQAEATQAIQAPAGANNAVQASIPGQPNTTVVTSLPAVIPVQSTAPAYANQVPAQATQPVSAEAALIAENERAMSQLQSQYTQQYNNFVSQNKQAQEQMQALSARVSAMENQLNQLVQALTKRSQDTSMVSPPPVSAAPLPQSQPSLEAKIAYNVQAIIPGRAWLKADNGEMITVAEGDVIKNVGRVIRIDPYDGVVEINTGNRAVSLSYGNGG